MLEQRAVARGRSVVDLVDDDDLERVGVERLDRFVAQRLHHREDVAADERLLAVAEDLSEVGVLEDGGVGRAALVEDAPAVSDEEETGLAAEVIAEPAVVERGHDRLAGARRGDEQVAVAVVAVPLGLQLFEHSCLMRLGRDVEGHEAAAEVASLRPALTVECLAKALTVLLGVEAARRRRLPSRSRTSRAFARRGTRSSTSLRRTFHSIPWWSAA